MSRRTISILPLLAISVAVAGCGTIYSDVYGPYRNHYAPLPEKPSIPILAAPPAPGDTTPLSPGGSSSPAPRQPTPVMDTLAPEPLAAPMTPEAAPMPGL